jgi:hypothetical protein
MTLCVAWIRKSPNGNELIFATDSCLGMGERWDSGVKLFQLPRTDCLICFSGYTARTYPLILNLINLLKYDKYLLNQSHDITLLVNYISEQFTEIIKTIRLSGKKTFEDVLKGDPEFDFLFGGWSWKENTFKLWRIFYSYESHGFVFNSDYEGLVFAMIGDRLDEARDKLEQEIVKNKRALSGYLDMEPLKVLVEIIREPTFDSISGAVQLAKIYPPGITEVFGVYYPSIEGTKTFLGRDVSKTNNPSVRFVDPDTGSISGQEVPSSITGIDTTVFGVNEEFVTSCYEGVSIRENLTEKESELLQSVFKDYAYKQYLQSVNNNLEIEQSVADV